MRGAGEPILYGSSPPGVDPGTRRAMLDGTRALNALAQKRLGDPAIDDRIAQYEMAFRMQSAVPELVDLTTGKITCRVKKVYRTIIRFKGSEIRRG